MIVLAALAKTVLPRLSGSRKRCRVRLCGIWNGRDSIPDLPGCQ